MLKNPLAGKAAGAIDSTPVPTHDGPQSDEIVLWSGYAAGPRVNARSKGLEHKHGDELIASFSND